MRDSNTTSIFTRREATQTAHAHGMTLLVNRLRRESLGPEIPGVAGIQLPVGHSGWMVRPPTVPTRAANRRTPEGATSMMCSEPIAHRPPKASSVLLKQTMRLSEECCEYESKRQYALL